MERNSALEVGSLTVEAEVETAMEQSMVSAVLRWAGCLMREAWDRVQTATDRAETDSSTSFNPMVQEVISTRASLTNTTASVRKFKLSH